MIRVYLSGALQQLPKSECIALVNDFKAYVSGATFCPHFGRDERYDHPHTPPLILAEEVRHVHLEDPQNPWPPGWPQFRKTSDHHLVYCCGAMNPDVYLLIAILSPDAHKQSRSSARMVKLGTMAEKFRQQF